MLNYQRVSYTKKNQLYIDIPLIIYIWNIDHGSASDAHQVPVSTVAHWTGVTAGTAPPCTGRHPGGTSERWGMAKAMAAMVRCQNENMVKDHGKWPIQSIQSYWIKLEDEIHTIQLSFGMMFNRGIRQIPIKMIFVEKKNTELVRHLSPQLAPFCPQFAISCWVT